MNHRRYVHDLGVEFDCIELGEEVGPVPATNAMTNQRRGRRLSAQFEGGHADLAVRRISAFE
jgi:hypothetical protein